MLKPHGVAVDWRLSPTPGAANIRARWRRCAPAASLSASSTCCTGAISTSRSSIFGIDTLGEEEKQNLNLAWHRLDAWPDVPSGLLRLKRKYLLAPVSNGNISLMVDLARRNNLPWDAILGAEIAGDYKPKPRVYLASAAAFDLAPEACMMVAAHSKDLAAAAALGLRTAHVARPNEHGPGRGEAAPTMPVDFAAKTLEALAEMLGL